MLNLVGNTSARQSSILTRRLSGGLGLVPISQYGAVWGERSRCLPQRGATIISGVRQPPSAMRTRMGMRRRSRIQTGPSETAASAVHLSTPPAKARLPGSGQRSSLICIATTTSNFHLPVTTPLLGLAHSTAARPQPRRSGPRPYLCRHSLRICQSGRSEYRPQCCPRNSRHSAFVLSVSTFSQRLDQVDTPIANARFGGEVNRLSPPCARLVTACPSSTCTHACTRLGL